MDGFINWLNTPIDQLGFAHIVILLFIILVSVEYAVGVICTTIIERSKDG